MSAILFIVILAVLVFIHELGHFLIAKKTGVRVDEFAVGFPPKLFSFKRGETVYSLNAIPFGGYVKIFGEDPNEESIKGKDSSRSLVNKPKYIQIAVLIGGILFNILFAWLLISASLMSGYKMPVESATYPVTNAKITILSVLENSPAKIAGLMAGDEIIGMKEGDSVSITPQEVPDVQKFISESKSKIQISYERGSEIKTVDVEPALGIAGDNRAIGISMSKVGEVHLPFFKALWEGAKLTWDVVYQTFFSLIDFFGKVFRGKADISQVSGPVGIAGLVGDASHFGFIYLLGFTAFISINLAVINFMPFPALDGGRIFFIIIEAIIRRPISPKILNFVNALGFMFLIGLMLYVTYFDIVKLF
ncbi:MAG: site-2 protease family protein [bacterium]